MGSMKATTRLSALTDSAVLEFAKRLQRKRVAIAPNPYLAISAPSSSGQGLLRRMGFGKVDIAISPEITLAMMLREWRGLHAVYSFLALHSAKERVDEAQAVQASKSLNDKIGLVEYRVFGTSPGPSYPQFESLEEWLCWRLQMAHPEHRCGDRNAGWKPELFLYAAEEALLVFDGG